MAVEGGRTGEEEAITIIKDPTTIGIAVVIGLAIVADMIMTGQEIGAIDATSIHTGTVDPILTIGEGGPARAHVRDHPDADIHVKSTAGLGPDHDHTLHDLDQVQGEDHRDQGHTRNPITSPGVIQRRAIP